LKTAHYVGYATLHKPSGGQDRQCIVPTYPPSIMGSSGPVSLTSLKNEHCMPGKIMGTTSEHHGNMKAKHGNVVFQFGSLYRMIFLMGRL